jgi:hypothetical protein
MQCIVSNTIQHYKYTSFANLVNFIWLSDVKISYYFARQKYLPVSKTGPLSYDSHVADDYVETILAKNLCCSAIWGSGGSSTNFPGEMDKITTYFKNFAVLRCYAASVGS